MFLLGNSRISIDSEVRSPLWEEMDTAEFKLLNQFEFVVVIQKAYLNLIIRNLDISCRVWFSERLWISSAF